MPQVDAKSEENANLLIGGVNIIFKISFDHNKLIISSSDFIIAIRIEAFDNLENGTYLEDLAKIAHILEKENFDLIEVSGDLYT